MLTCLSCKRKHRITKLRLVNWPCLDLTAQQSAEALTWCRSTLVATDCTCLSQHMFKLLILFMYFIAKLQRWAQSWVISCNIQAGIFATGSNSNWNCIPSVGVSSGRKMYKELCLYYFMIKNIDRNWWELSGSTKCCRHTGRVNNNLYMLEHVNCFIHCRYCYIMLLILSSCQLTTRFKARSCVAAPAQSCVTRSVWRTTQHSYTCDPCLSHVVCVDIQGDQRWAPSSSCCTQELLCSTEALTVVFEHPSIWYCVSTVVVMLNVPIFWLYSSSDQVICNGASKALYFHAEAKKVYILWVLYYISSSMRPSI